MSEQEDGKAFVLCPISGEINFGTIDAPELKALGLPHGPIRLQVGYMAGFGCRHIEGYADRVKQIQGLEYRTVPHFCEAVARNYNRIGRAQDGRLILLWLTGTYDLQLIVQWNESGFWTVVTAVPTRVARKYEALCEVVRTGEREPTPDVAKRPRFATLSLPKKVLAGDNGS